MHRLPKFMFTVLLICAPLAHAAAPDQPQVANLGDLKLENGQVLKDCRVAYRTFGQLNADKSNVVLFPTWFSGSSADLASHIGPNKLIDSSRYYVIAVDALANGVSSSPTNSAAQPRMQFPQISIRDMVQSQHELLTRTLSIKHVKAVMGISMGGMQTFQWVLSYPDFMDRAIPIVGSPQLAPYDLLLWRANLDAIQRDPDWKNGNYVDEPVLATVQDLAALMLTTVEQFNRDKTRKEVLESIRKRTVSPFGAADRVIQLKAMMGHDVSLAFGGRMAKAASEVKAKLLVVVSVHDHMVTPGPAIEFAKLSRAQLLELSGNCGHNAPKCELAKIAGAITKFLEER